MRVAFLTCYGILFRKQLLSDSIAVIGKHGHITAVVTGNGQNLTYGIDANMAGAKASAWYRVPQYGDFPTDIENSNFVA